MKSIFTTLFLICVFSLYVLADPISVETANQVGQSFLSQPVSATGKLKTKKQQTSLKLVYTAEVLHMNLGDPSSTRTAQDVVPFYVFSTDNQGYVIVSGDDRAIPILGYAEDGFFDPNNIPPNMRKWLEGYKAEIRYAIEKNIVAPATIQSQWQTLKSGAPLKSESIASSVAPLLTTKWDQSPYYNNQCPYDYDEQERAVTGCVATAMAQVMKYWEYPQTGSGFHSYAHSTYGTLSANFGGTTYDWTNMPTQLTSTSTSVQSQAIGELMYHCGVSVDMEYGVSSSGAYVVSSSSADENCAEYALKTYFGYISSLQGIEKHDYTNTSWMNLLKTELNAERPIIYAGFGDGGHCFVCDGYDNNDYFHFNWGWSGYADGYFALNALNPGSGGIGGGSYSFNDDQQAIIGIEPGTSTDPSTETYDLQLYSEITMPSAQIWFTDPIDLDVSIANFGTADFNGDFGAAIFDLQDNFVDFIEVKLNRKLELNSYYVNGLTFSNPGSPKFVPGNYYAAVFYRESNKDWTIISDGNYTNRIEFGIYYSTDIEVNSDITITTNEGNLIQGEPATVNVDVLNTGTNTFYGKYRVSLSNLDGNWVQNIQILNESDGLPSNNHYEIGNNFTGTIEVEPGTYLMEVAYQRQGTTTWYYAGSSNYSNPVYVIVKAPELVADIYEDNNTQSAAYKLPVSFSGNTAIRNSEGSNLHIGTDIDYYKIVLPSGYNYTVASRLHDNYSSENGETYSVDAQFSYSINGTVYSETYDDVMSGTITLNNGGTLYFKVSPYFSGDQGTYLLDLNLNRNAITAIENNDDAVSISIFPNPANEFAKIMAQEFPGKIRQVVLCDVNGNELYRENVAQNKSTILLPLTNVANGVYFVRIYSDKGIITKKLVVEK